LECPPKEKTPRYQNILLQNYTYTQNKMMFNPQNIRLGGQSERTPKRPTARTRKGIHLHLSINNQHHISNDNIFDYPLPDGSYDLFAFIAHAYYESIKNPDAIMGRHIEVKNGNLVGSRPIEHIAIVYNAPHGTHEIEESDSLLFDFVLYGSQLSEAGNYVTLEINDQAPMRIDQWQAYYLTGFKEGEQRLRLTLNNSQGKAITSAVEQRFMVKKPEKLVN
jgi:hypothetical protein